jgi:serine/threonine-protein phosphatase 6 regulatory ankyrin repeat subunit B
MESLFFKAVKEGNEGEVARLLDDDPSLLEKVDHEGLTPYLLAAAHGQLGVMQLLIQRGADASATTSISGDTALHMAAWGGQEQATACLLGQGAQSTHREADGSTPFMLACKQGHLGVVRLLAQSFGKQELEATDETGFSALHYAAESGHGETVTFLLGQGTLANSKDEEGATPLMLACQKGHLNVLKVLLQHVGLQALQETDNQGWTALHHAALWGHEEAVTFLLGKGAQANSRDENDTTPFMISCQDGHMGVARLLLQHVGAQVAQEADDRGWTPLHSASRWGHEETVTFLLGQGAQANSKDENGATPFMMACWQGHLGVVRLLLQHMGPIMGPQALQETDTKGRTVLHYAVSCHKEDIVSLVSFLIGRGAQANSRDEEGATPLILACGKGHMGVAKALLQHVGAQALQEADNEGKTPLHYAAMWGHEETATFLLGQGAQANSRDEKGTTPLLWACAKGRTGVMQILVQHMGKQAVQETGNNGVTALHTAAYCGHEETAAFLISQGAECSSMAMAVGVTPLMFACWEGRLAVVRLLIQHIGPEALRQRDRNGRVALHWACVKGHGAVVRALLIGGADLTVTDNAGRTPRAIAEMEEEEDDDEEDDEKEKGSRAGCVAAFEVRKLACRGPQLSCTVSLHPFTLMC